MIAVISTLILTHSLKSIGIKFFRVFSTLNHFSLSLLKFYLASHLFLLKTFSRRP